MDFVMTMSKIGSIEKDFPAPIIIADQPNTKKDKMTIMMWLCQQGNTILKSDGTQCLKITEKVSTVYSLCGQKLIKMPKMVHFGRF